MRRTVALLLLLAACTTAKHPRATESPSPTATAPATAAPTATPATPAKTLPPLPGPPRLALVGRFDSPVYVTSPPGDRRLFVVEKTGRVRIVGKAAPFLDLSGQVSTGSEQGLLSIAFPPDYATAHRFYADFTDTNGDTRVVEYAASGDRADARSARLLLKVAQPYPNHNGGLLLFDPSGMLIVGLGDGGSAGDPGNRAQNLGVLLGKLLRIDPRGRPYGIPKDNPFAGRKGARPEVWAYGLRNPWRFAFDPPTGTLYIGDVGQGSAEEVDVVPTARQAGANYGWHVFEGTRRYGSGGVSGNVVFPPLTYGHDHGRCAITGGVLYRGRVARLRGRYLYADYCTGEVWSVDPARPRPVRLPFTAGNTSSFGVDAAGEVYVTSLGGEVWRITA